MSSTRSEKQQNEYLIAILNEIRTVLSEVKKLDKEIKATQKTLKDILAGMPRQS